MYPTAYIQYLVHFHGDRDYFECHEILEEYWKELEVKDKQSIWVGFILLAVSNYHFRRQNKNGAVRTLAKALTIFRAGETSQHQLGIDMAKLLLLLEQRLIDIQNDIPYKSFNLPIIDKSLLKLCLDATQASGFIWGQDSNLNQVDLIDRHKLRDRSDVNRERQLAIAKRKQKEDRDAD
ncbi:DUF309 domain-containing protein [Bacillus marasmi]|uniref:DUF309 domain-containing protein n=1 Tax=Bacillus marasmi TaxID=1926279 RepID=UPI0011CA3019|nr:DUF309 domain-containing protein [Bacillus marasmi]